MRKWIMSLSAMSLFITSSMSLTACNPSNGEVVKFLTDNAPEKAKNTDDPVNSYTYNDEYGYDITLINQVLWVVLQLAADKIAYDKDTNVGISDIWKAFYNSDSYLKGNYSSISYNKDPSTPTVNSFSYKGKNDNNIVTGLTDNDATKKQFLYWFVLSATPGGLPDSSTLVIPQPNEFADNQARVTRTGWIHMVLAMNQYQIAFNARINVVFQKIVDKIGTPVVVINNDSAQYPMGKIDFYHPENTFKDTLANMDISNK